MTQIASVGASLDNVATWLRSVWTAPLAPLHRTGPASLLPTCFAVLACECCGVLEQLPAELRSATADYLLRQQSAQSGLFELGSIERKDLTSHSASYLRLQATYFAVHALDALGYQAPYTLPLVDRLLSREYAWGWLDGGPWHDPWLHSNTIMFALSFLQVEHDRNPGKGYLRAYDGVLDYLDARQDPGSGLWQRDVGRDDANAVFAAYHFFPFYFWSGRRPNHTERIIDTTLAIQQPDGFFKAAGGGACEDLDAVHTLIMMSLATSYRGSDICAALQRCSNAIIRHQQRDGGFRNYNVTRGARLNKRALLSGRLNRILLGSGSPDPTWRCGGWRPLSCPVTESDTWAAWFRPLSLKLIADHSGQTASNSRGRYRRIPGLGWHDPQKIKGSQPNRLRAESTAGIGTHPRLQ